MSVLRQARDLLAQARWAEAEQLATRALETSPAATAHEAALCFTAGVAALEQRRLARAVPLLRRAAAVDPAQAATWVQLARALSQAQRGAEALDAAQRATVLDPQDPSMLDTLGVVFSRADRHEDAVQCFERAVRGRPAQAAFQFNLASSLKFLGRFVEAESAYEACIANDAAFWKAHSALAQLRRQTRERNHLARLERLLERPALPVEAQLHLNLALAKELEDLDEPRRAFVHTTRGKSAIGRSLDYRSEQDRRLFDALHDVFARAEVPAAAITDSAQAPIFVVGMPRTGTTLVERILGSHPDVRAVGESQNLPRAIKRLAATRSAEVLDVDTIHAAAHASPAAIAAAGARYLTDTRPATAARFVDKMPMNFFYAGFIRRALPQARVLCLRRHPLDACLSNYRQLFALNFPYYRYACDLLDTGRYYLMFDRLVAHWQRLLPGLVMEVQYEALVAAPEAQIRRVLDFVGLDFHEACLHSERNPAPTSTASAVQVRQPIHRGSVGRWQSLERELSELRAMLETEGVDCAAA